MANAPAPSLWQTVQLAVTQKDSFRSYATSTHKFILVQGISYVAVGLLSVVLPALVADAFLIPDPAVSDLAWLRIVGVAVTTIGYLYIQLSRMIDIGPVVLYTTFNRVTFVPVLLLYILLCGSSPQVCISFALLGPLLAVLTHYVWTRDMVKQA